MKRISIIACVLLLAVAALAQTPTQKTVVTLSGPGTHTVTVPITDQDQVLNYQWVRSATPGGEDWTQAQTLPGNATQIVDTGVPGGTWYYEARGIETGGTSPTSNEVNGSVPLPAPVLGTPVVTGP
jgi:hypothetical protein